MKTKSLEKVLVNGDSEKDHRKTAEEMDEIRQKNLSYEYLCHLEEAKKWMEACLRESLPPTTDLEENLRNGVFLAKLGHFMAPDILPLTKIFDIEQKRYLAAGLQFRHTDNINRFLQCLKTMHLPLTFQPETTDIYDKKNMPRLIYCIHALSTHLFKLGRAPQMQDLYGKITFTDEEIDLVSKELKKYGIKMPSFQKIGGLLTNSVPGDTAALHAAVIAVNSSLTSKDKHKVLSNLQNPSIQLKEVNPNQIDIYYEVLSDAKETKMTAALNKSLNESYVPDAYDELLTQAEIQGHIFNVNVQCALEDLEECIHDNKKSIVLTLKNPSLQLESIIPENSDAYKKEFGSLLKSEEWQEKSLENCQYWQKKLQKYIDSANQVAEQEKKRNKALKLLNTLLENGARTEFFEILHNPDLGVSNYVDPFALPLYYEEMKIDHLESKNDLTYNDLVVSLRVLSSIASVSKAIDSKNHDLVYEALVDSHVHIENLDPLNKVKYSQALAAIRREKLTSTDECALLTYIDIQECVDLVNDQCLSDSKVINVLKNLNVAVSQNCRSGLMEALKQIAVKLQRSVSAEDTTLYLRLFLKCLEDKHSDGSELWLDDVEDVTQAVMAEAEEVQTICTVLVQVNIGLERNDLIYTIDCIESLGIKIADNYKFPIHKALRKLKIFKNDNYTNYCVKYITTGGNDALIDLKNFNYTWDLPDCIPESYFVTLTEIKDTIKYITMTEISKLSKESMEDIIIKLQARVRGFLVRKGLADKFTHYYNNIDKVIKIQSWWRAMLARKYFLEYYDDKKAHNCKNTCSLIDYCNQNSWMDHYKKHEDKIIKIQALWRGRAARKIFHELFSLEKPSFSVVKYFSSVLNVNAEDYDKDLEHQRIKNEVVQLIRRNQNLSQQLNSMDIKIGLLIQNRILLSEVVDHGKHLERLKNEKHGGRVCKSSITEPNLQKGLKSLTKEGRRLLEGYQHLFYALQTNPIYLSKLLFLLPQSKTNKFLQNVILTLFNFGSSLREEYLLLKLFGSALREEIRCKFQKPAEVVTGNPLVLKMAVNYARQLNGQKALREILSANIQKILDDKSIAIETNPVDIYKSWRNKMETESGESSELPYTVSPQVALQYENIRNRLDNGIRLLKITVSELLERITSSRDLIPYGMLYMAKVLYDTLGEKFPSAPEKDILKVVGNLIYYHFINAAIVAPDAFDIINLPSDKSLSNDQRRNLASIAKILQFAASKKGFGEEATHLVCLNPFIIECHEKFKTFFKYCCEIEELEDHFNIHEYTEATLIHKPEITISLQEICDTHCLVLEYQDQIAPDPLDPLHELLEDLGTAPTVASLLGLNEMTNELNIARHGKTEVCFVLNNKFEVPETDDMNLSSLFIKTKELLVSVIEFLNGDNLIEALKSPTTSNEERAYDEVMSSLPPLVKKCGSLQECKIQLRAYLNKLELGGWVSRDDDYQRIISAVAKDLCNKGQYRQLRNKELQMLKLTKQRLEEKSNYYEEQVTYYNEYIKQCLENLHSDKSTLRALKIGQKNNQKKLKSKMTLKYSAAKLQEKGVLLEVDGLPTSQFKNVIFEISPTERTGIFTVRGKFMGVEMEKVEIDIQRLLELQFEGSPIMDMFGKAKINVNLLLYLLNRKFYNNK